MNFEKLKLILDKIVENPIINDALQKKRDNRSYKDNEGHSIGLLLKALGATSLCVAIFGGKAARKIEVIVIVLSLLVEVSVLVKESFIDDPAIQKMIREAWEELAAQSSSLYSVARGVVRKAICRFRHQGVTG